MRRLLPLLLSVLLLAGCASPAAPEEEGAKRYEATISYSIFLMVIVTMLYIMRIVYAYGLIQHATCQTAKELSMYTLIFNIC